MVNWTLIVVVTFLWLILATWEWNNRWRMLTDRAPLYSSALGGLAVTVLPIALPVIAGILLYFVVGILLCAIYLFASWLTIRAIARWKYRTVFNEYAKLAVWDWRERGRTLSSEDLIRIEEETKYLLSENLRQ